MSEHENYTVSDSDEHAQAHQTFEAQVHDAAGSPAVIPCSSVIDVDSDNLDLSLVPYREQHPQNVAAPTATVTRSCRKDLDPNYCIDDSEEDKDQDDNSMDDSDGSSYGANTKTKKRGGRPKKGAKKNNKSSSATAAASSNTTKAATATKATAAKRGKSRGRGGKAAQTAASHVASADAADADIDAADAANAANAATSSGSKRKSPDQATISSKQAPAAKRVKDSPSDAAIAAATAIHNADADDAPPSDQEQHLQALRATVSTLQTVIVAVQASVDGVQADLALKDHELSESRAANDALSTTNAELHASIANMTSSSSSRTRGGGARAQLSKRATQSDKQILNLLHDQKCDLEAECKSLRARVGNLVQEVLGDSLAYQQNSDPYIKQLWTLAQWTIRDGASQILNVLPEPDDIPPVPPGGDANDGGDGGVGDGRVGLLRHKEVLELAAKCRESPRKMRPLIETYLWQLALAQISVKGLWGGESGRDFTRFCKSLARK